MKKSIIYLGLLIVSFSSCRKITDDVSTTVTVSYPTITLNGAEIVSTIVAATGTYTDPGATGTDDITGATSTLIPVSNDVDLTTPGFYSVKYTIKNSNGYITSKTRLVLVTPVDPAIDLSGTYARTSNGCLVTVTKQGPGLYTTSNVGGVLNNPPYIFDVYFGQISAAEIAVPTQPNALGGDIYCDNTSLNVDAVDTAFAWIVRGSGFGTSLRTFSHQ